MPTIRPSVPPSPRPPRPSSSRRQFLATAPLAGLAGAVLPAAAVLRAQPPPASPPFGEWFPLQDPALAKEVVGVSHRDLNRVRELVERQPALARAAIDWGFGDWESALGAASHTGRREIAELLIAHGARPTLFSAAMLGQLPVVRAFVESSPGIQKTLGPHAIPLAAHARAGGPAAAEVLKYLQTVGDADLRPTTAPLAPSERDAVVGRYDFGTGPRDHFLVEVRNDQLGIERPGGNRQLIHHTGGLVFFPSGVPSVRIAFHKDGPRTSQLTVADPDVMLTARRA
ncbi:MAG: hypothetical protein R2708_14540 [Vicinamibacterales bacterium]